jgi:RimJ/RimL family protein N-acetyltransferase
MKISGLRVILRDEPRTGDDGDFFRWMNMAEWNYYDEPDKPFKPISRAAFAKLLAERRRRAKTSGPDSHTWQINTVAGRHIGWVNYYQLDEQAGRAYVGLDLPEEETWNQGYGTEALSLLIDYLFGEMGLQEVRAATWTGHKRMRRCAEKCGFQEIARRPHRAQFSVRGEPLERMEFAISRSKWRDSS